MIFRQFFERDTYTYTYLLADTQSKEAVLIDPVDVHIELYLTLLDEFDLKLKHAVDTHVHADHITALGALRKRTACATYIGRQGSVACSDQSLSDGQLIPFGAHALQVIYTPGHTDDSHCFLLQGGPDSMLFTGDTLLIRGTGRTDFQNGSSEQLYHSLWQKILTLGDDTWIYPGHDYRGMTRSTVGEERRHNPRLKWSKDEFINGMARLKLPDPKFMDIAVPANQQCGQVTLNPTGQ